MNKAFVFIFQLMSDTVVLFLPLANNTPYASIKSSFCGFQETDQCSRNVIEKLLAVEGFLDTQLFFVEFRHLFFLIFSSVLYQHLVHLIVHSIEL